MFLLKSLLTWNFGWNREASKLFTSLIIFEKPFMVDKAQKNTI